MGTAFLWIVIGTSLWMAFDAHQIGYDKKDVKGMAGMGTSGFVRPRAGAEDSARILTQKKERLHA